MIALTAEQRERYGRALFDAMVRMVDRSFAHETWDELGRGSYCDQAAAVIAAYLADTADERAALNDVAAAAQMYFSRKATPTSARIVRAALAALDAARQEKTT
jgi:hypothetical protein